MWVDGAWQPHCPEMLLSLCRELNLYKRNKKLPWERWRWSGEGRKKGPIWSHLSGSWSREMPSATIMKIPRICRALIWRLYMADSQIMIRKQNIKKGFRDVPLLMAITILSDWIHVRLFLQYGAQRQTARKTARTSFVLIWRLATKGHSNFQLQ